MSDKIAVMDQGLLRQLGTPEEIYRKPANLFVAKFVGSPRINVIYGEVVSDGDTNFFVCGQLKSEIGQKIKAWNKQVIGTIRPEDIDISRKEWGGWLKTRAYSVLPAGSETIITVQNDSLFFSIKLNGFTDIRMNDAIWIHFDPLKINYYDQQTEKLIGTDR